MSNLELKNLEKHYGKNIMERFALCVASTYYWLRDDIVVC